MRVQRDTGATSNRPENPTGPSEAARETRRRPRRLVEFRPVKRGRLPMGATHVNVTVRNPADPDRTWEGRFLVDTGAMDSLVPRQHLEAIGIAPVGSRTYELADGTRRPYHHGLARIEFMDEVVAGKVVFVEDDTAPLLGLTALESAGIEVDPRNERLKRLSAIRLKSLTPV